MKGNDGRTKVSLREGTSNDGNGKEYTGHDDVGEIGITRVLQPAVAGRSDVARVGEPGTSRSSKGLSIHTAVVVPEDDEEDGGKDSAERPSQEAVSIHVLEVCSTCGTWAFPIISLCIKGQYWLRCVVTRS